MSFSHLDKVDPTQCLSSKINRIVRLTDNIFRKHLSVHDLTSSQLSMLFVILKKKEITQKGLAEILFMEKSSVNRNLKRMVQRGYISKEQFPLLSLSSDGRALLERVIPSWNLAMDEIRECLNQDGEEAVNNVLDKLKHTNL